jgi:putative transferase (TIGR04331 family)
VLLNEITYALNRFHGTSHSPVYWNIVLGNWLARYVSVCYNRFFTISNLLELNEISATSIFKSQDYSLVVPDTATFNNIVNNSIWNNSLYFRVLSFLGFSNFNFIELGDESKTIASDEKAKIGTVNFRQYLKLLITKILGLFSRDSDALIINSYLPRKEEFKLQLRLLQVPQIRSILKFQDSKVDPVLRSNFTLTSQNLSGFEKFIRDMLPEMIPTCFLEGLEKVEAAKKESSWPVRPKFIFTSNNFATDEVFKLWTAQKVDVGVPYYVGQHGNIYGIHGDHHGASHMSNKLIACSQQSLQLIRLLTVKMQSVYLISYQSGSCAVQSKVAD